MCIVLRWTICDRYVPTLHHLASQDGIYCCSAASCFLARPPNALRKFQLSTSQNYLSERKNITALRPDVTLKKRGSCLYHHEQRRFTVQHNTSMSRSIVLHVSKPRTNQLALVNTTRGDWWRFVQTEKCSRVLCDIKELFCTLNFGCLSYTKTQRDASE